MPPSLFHPVLRAGLLLVAAGAALAPAQAGAETFTRAAALPGLDGALAPGHLLRLASYRLPQVADPLRDSTFASTVYLTGGASRVEHGAEPEAAPVRRFAHPLAAGTAYAIVDQLDTSPAGRAWGMTVGFERGPLTMRAAYRRLSAVQVQLNSETSNATLARNAIVAANLRLGPATAYTGYSISRGGAGAPLFNPDNPYAASISRAASASSRDLLAGLALPLEGGTTLLASYTRKDDRDLANLDAHQLAFGASHTLSRRTDFYAAWSQLRQRSGAPALARASGGALNVGMRHAF